MTPRSPKLSDYSLSIRWFYVISWTLFRGGILPLCRNTVGVFYNPSQLGSLPRTDLPLNQITHFSKLQGWSLTIRCSLVSYPGYPLGGVGVLPLRKSEVYVFSSHSRQGGSLKIHAITSYRLNSTTTVLPGEWL